MSDWDIMMQRRKDAMARARRRRRKDVDITANDDHIMAMIQQMKEASEEDRHLNMDRKAATKKLQMLPTVVTHLKKLAHLTNKCSYIICSLLHIIQVPYYLTSALGPPELNTHLVQKWGWACSRGGPNVEVIRYVLSVTM